MASVINTVTASAKVLTVVPTPTKSIENPDSLWNSGWDLQTSVRDRRLSITSSSSRTSGRLSPKLYVLAEKEIEDKNESLGNTNSNAKGIDPTGVTDGTDEISSTDSKNGADILLYPPGGTGSHQSGNRTLSFDAAIAQKNAIWPFDEAQRSLQVKRPSLVSVKWSKWPLVPSPEQNSLTATNRDDELLQIDIKKVVPVGSETSDIQKARDLLLRFQNAYKTRSDSIQGLEQRAIDTENQLQESKNWVERLLVLQNSMSSRIGEQEKVLLELAQELAREKEKRQEEDDEAIQFKLDGLNRVMPESGDRRRPSVHFLHRGSTSTQGTSDSSSSYGRSRSRQASPSSSLESFQENPKPGADINPRTERRPSLFAKMISGFSPSRTAVVRKPSTDSRVSNAPSTVLSNQTMPTSEHKTLEELRLECQILKKRLESLELNISSCSEMASVDLA